MNTKNFLHSPIREDDQEHDLTGLMDDKEIVGVM